jgi:hypothetical protein
MPFFKLLGRNLAIVSIILITISLIVGFWLDWKGFTINLLAATVGVFVSFIIGIKILSRYTEAQRKFQWEKVRVLTYTSISNHLYDIMGQAGIDYETSFSPKSMEGRDHPDSVVAEAMLEFCAKLQNLPGANSYDNTLSDIAVKLYHGIHYDLDHLCDVLLPRVIQESSDQKLIDALVEFDRARWNLRNGVVVHTQITIGGIFPDIIILLKQAHLVYSTLIELYPKKFD